MAERMSEVVMPIGLDSTGLMSELTKILKQTDNLSAQITLDVEVDTKEARKAAEETKKLAEQMSASIQKSIDSINKNMNAMDISKSLKEAQLSLDEFTKSVTTLAKNAPALMEVVNNFKQISTEMKSLSTSSGAGLGDSLGLDKEIKSIKKNTDEYERLITKLNKIKKSVTKPAEVSMAGETSLTALNSVNKNLIPTIKELSAKRNSGTVKATSPEWAELTAQIVEAKKQVNAYYEKYKRIFPSAAKSKNLNPYSFDVEIKNINTVIGRLENLKKTQDSTLGDSSLKASQAETASQVNNTTNAIKEQTKAIEELNSALAKNESAELLNKDFSTNSKREAINQLKEASTEFSKYYGDIRKENSEAGTRAGYAYNKAWLEAMHKGVATSTLDRYTVDSLGYNSEGDRLDEIEIYSLKLRDFSNVYDEISTKIKGNIVPDDVHANIERYVNALEQLKNAQATVERISPEEYNDPSLDTYIQNRKEEVAEWQELVTVRKTELKASVDTYNAQYSQEQNLKAATEATTTAIKEKVEVEKSADAVTDKSDDIAEEQKLANAISQTNQERQEAVALEQKVDTVDGVTSPTATGEAAQFEAIRLKVNELSEAIRLKTQEIVKEENQMRTSAAKEVSSLDAILKKVHEVKGALEEVGAVKIDAKVTSSKSSGTTKSSDNTGSKTASTKEVAEEIRLYKELDKTVKAYEATSRKVSSKADDVAYTEMKAIAEKQLLSIEEQRANIQAKGFADKNKELQIDATLVSTKDRLTQKENEHVAALEKVAEAQRKATETAESYNLSQTEITNMGSFINGSAAMSTPESNLIDAGNLQSLRENITATYNRIVEGNFESREALEKTTTEFKEQQKAILDLTKAENQMYLKGKGQFLGTISGEANDYANINEQMQNLIRTYNSGVVSVGNYNEQTRRLPFSIRDASGQIVKMTANLDNSGKVVRTVTKDMAASVGPVSKYLGELGSKFGDITRYLMSAGSIYTLINYGRQGVTVVREIDTAMTELKKVTDETMETYERFPSVAINVGKAIGTTGRDIIEATAQWARLGLVKQSLLTVM